VGAVGQPRDNDPRAAYVIYHKEEGIIELRRVEYDIAETRRKIKQSGLG
jgi:diadenosine tetraphosphatase ApaH/serine/threonine PP2A family protein phosphatase